MKVAACPKTKIKKAVLKTCIKLAKKENGLIILIGYWTENVAQDMVSLSISTDGKMTFSLI